MDLRIYERKRDGAGFGLTCSIYQDVRYFFTSKTSGIVKQDFIGTVNQNPCNNIWTMLDMHRVG